MRSDDIDLPGTIIEQIWDKIQEAQIIIADATGKNPNVYYEMGLADAIGKDIIIIAQKTDDIPFDVKHRRVIIYNANQLGEFGVKLSKIIVSLKWEPIQIQQWLTTNQNSIRIGLSSPTNDMIVYKRLIRARGRIVGLPSKGLHFYIRGFVITDKEYEQGASSVDSKGYWEINQISLGATIHKLFFRIYDESGLPIAKSEKITIYEYEN